MVCARIVRATAITSIPMSLDAIEAAFEETYDNNADDDDDLLPLAPISGGYITAVDEKHLRTRLVDVLLHEKHDVASDKSVGDLLDVFSPGEFDINTLDKAAGRALGDAATDINEPEYNIGLWAAISVIKSEWGDRHRNAVEHGVGLDHPRDDNDLEYSTVRRDSYGDHHPELPAFDDVVGWDTLDDDEAEHLESKYDIPTTEIGVIDGRPRMIAPDGERLPLMIVPAEHDDEGRSPKEQLSDAIDRLMDMPELEGDEYDGDAVTSSETSTSDEPDVGDEVPIPGGYNVKQLRKMVSNLKDPEVIEQMIELEKSNKDRTSAIDRLESRLNRLRSDDGGDDDESDPIDAAVTDVVESTSDDGHDFGSDVPEPGTVPKWKFELALNNAGMPGERAAEIADSEYDG